MTTADEIDPEECQEDILDAPPRFAVTPADPDAAGVYDDLLTPEDIAAWGAWQAETDARLAAEDRGYWHTPERLEES